MLEGSTYRIGSLIAPFVFDYGDWTLLAQSRLRAKRAKEKLFHESEVAVNYKAFQ